MPRGEANGCRASNHQWGPDVVIRTEAQFFLEFAQDCSPGVLITLDMTPRGQPQLCVPVIHQQNMINIHDDEIRNEMLRRGRGSCYANKFGARINPAESVRQMFTLDSVERYDCRKLGAYDVSHVN